ncbi:carbohydrate-binding module family 13 protein [Tulasnella calospora MUT 4182]|uniref:Carbohydrate-binding module family 13 protein n=1 Tax=Tulasnella calospora MUT 4182 TaxID=1051891 RepID=A0A0C3Q7S0_9AGAM|nr:carbohydrate-binding module family 13 protein [Tulasnella calospora MUT 4182]
MQSNTAAENAQWIPEGLYVLINKKTRTLVDLSGGHTESGSPIEGWSRKFDALIDHQFWVISRSESEGSYRIMSYRAGTFVDLVAQKKDPKSPVAAFNYVGSGASRFNQEWNISGGVDGYYTIECVGSHTFLEIQDGNAADKTHVTCSPRTAGGDHQLWELERVSRTAQEIKTIIGSWKPELLERFVQPYGDDVQYLVLPSQLRSTIWEGTKLLRQTVRKGTFDYDDFVIKAKDAVKTWARDRFRLDGYSVLFGVIYGEALVGVKAYNWYLSADMSELVFCDAQTNTEHTALTLDGFKFNPTFIVC